MKYITKVNNGHKAAATYVREYENGIEELVSYSTTVIIIDSEGWMTVTGLYSMTTIKHIGWFMRERGMTYQLAKQIYENNEIYNIHTGETQKRD